MSDDPPSPIVPDEPATPVVTVVDDQSDVALDHDRWADLAGAVLRSEGVTGPVELGLTFVDESTMAQLNADHLGATSPTDVLSFPLDLDEQVAGEPGVDRIVGADVGEARRDEGDDVDPSTAPLMAGDVVICPAVAHRNAPTHAGTPDDELALLVVHGTLHLLGHDHAEADERDAMWARERALLAHLHGPLAADPWTSGTHGS